MQYANYKIDLQRCTSWTCFNNISTRAGEGSKATWQSEQNKCHHNRVGVCHTACTQRSKPYILTHSLGWSDCENQIIVPCAIELMYAFICGWIGWCISLRALLSNMQSMEIEGHWYPYLCNASKRVHEDGINDWTLGNTGNTAGLFIRLPAICPVVHLQA